MVKRVKTKICLVGDQAVGKTSLIRRYVLEEFDDHYMMTLGTKVSKKIITLDFPDEDLGVQLEAGIWDIMGQPGLLDLLKEAYFTGAHGILAVVDMTSPQTLLTLKSWIRSVERITGPVPTFVAVNKVDLKERHLFAIEEVEAVARELGCDYLPTSARTGENVEEAFRRLASLISERSLGFGRGAWEPPPRTAVP